MRIIKAAPYILILGLILAGSFFVARAHAVVPTDIAGMVLWYDASQITGKVDGDTVTSWSDSSGNGWSATNGAFNAPTYETNEINGRPVVRFVAASSQALRSTYTQVGGSTAAWTMFVVARATGGADERIVGSIYPTNSNWLLGWHAAKEAVAYYNNGFVVGSGAVTHTFRQFTGKGDGTTGYFYAEGVLLGTLGGGAGQNPNGGIALSGYDGGGGTAELSNGEIAEVILYNGMLSDSDREAIEAYLHTKYFVVPSAASPALTISSGKLNVKSGKMIIK